MMLSVEEMERKLEARANRGCKSCVHLSVCALFRAIAPLLNQFEERKPFKAEELALICKEYMPVVAMPTTPP